MAGATRDGGAQEKNTINMERERLVGTVNILISEVQSDHINQQLHKAQVEHTVDRMGLSPARKPWPGAR